MSRHWQHLAATPEGVEEAIRLRETGLEPRHLRFLSWVRSLKTPITAGVATRVYFKLDFDVRDRRWHQAFAQSKTLLESLAFNGYLLRGRFHSKSTAPSGKFSGTHYRCSLKSRRLLLAHDPGRS